MKITEHEKDILTRGHYHSGIRLLLRCLQIFVKGQSVKEAKKMGDVDVNPSREHRSANRWMNCALSNGVRRKNDCYCSLDCYFFNTNGCNCSSSTNVSQSVCLAHSETARPFRCIKVSAHIHDGHREPVHEMVPQKTSSDEVIFSLVP